MKTIKIILILTCLTLCADGFAQLHYGIRGEISLNNPTVFVEELSCELEQAPALMFGVGGEIMLPLGDLGVEAALLYGTERLKANFQDSETSIEVKSQFMDIPITLKKSFDLALPVKPYVSAGLFAKIYISDSNSDNQTLINTFDKENFLPGLIAGAGAKIMDMVSVGVNYRYIFSDKNQRFGDEENMQKSLITVAASVYF